MIRTLLNSVMGTVVNTKTDVDRRADLYRNLIRREAKIGGELFGPTPPGVRREFFCLDDHTVVWHEEWVDANGKTQIKTVRYDVRPDGVLKTANGGHYQSVGQEEKTRLLSALKLYKQRAHRELYPFVSV